MYFLHGERLAAVHRGIAGTPTVRAAVTALLTGPTALEAPLGLHTTIPAGVQLRSVTIADGTAVIDLTNRFGSGGGSASMQGRVAELVYTATAVPGISKVRLWLDGQPATTLGGEGVIIDHALGRAEFEEQAGAILPDAPGYGDTVTSPVHVTGTANVFEAVLFVDVLGPDGRVLAHQQVKASSGTGTRGTFSTVLTFTIATRSKGIVHAYSRSPRDGTQINVAEIPVTIQP